MARIPSAQDINRQSPSFARPVATIRPDQSGAALMRAGEALGGIADASVRAEAQKKEKENKELLAIQKATANTNMQIAINETKNSFFGDTDYATQPDRYYKRTNDALEKAAGIISDPTERELFRQSARKNISNSYNSVAQNSFNVRKDMQLASINSSIDYFKTNYSSMPQEDRKSFASAMNQMIKSGIQSNTISYNRARELERDVVKHISQTEIDALTPQDRIAMIDGKSISLPDTTGNEVLDEAIELASAEHGVPFGVLAKFSEIESDHRINVVNSDSGAAGAFQFMPDVAKEYGVDDPTDPYQAALGAAKLYNRNKEFLQSKIGREPTPAEVYLMHQQGMGGAPALLQANEGELAVDVLTKVKNRKYAEAAIQNNGGNLDMTAQEFADIQMSKFDGGDKRRYTAVFSKEELIAMREEAEKQVQEINNRMRVASAISGEDYIDPTDKNQMKVYDDYVRDSLLPALDGLPYPEKNLSIVTQVSNTGVMPKSLRGDMKSKLRTGSDEDVIEAADLYMRFQEVSPQMVRDFTENDIQIAVNVANDVAAGIPANKAVALARQELEIENKPVFDFRKKQLSDKDVQKSLQSNAENFFNTWLPFENLFGNDVDLNTRVGNALYNDYKQAYERNYIHTGDEEKAKEFANLIVSGRYAQSQFNGGSLMKHAPEAIYSIPNQDNDWMVDQFESWAGLRSGMEKYDSDKWRILADRQTEREASAGTPSYQVLYMQEDGSWIAQDERWRPDPKAVLELRFSEAAKKRKSKRQDRDVLRDPLTASRIGVIPNE